MSRVYVSLALVGVVGLTALAQDGRSPAQTRAPNDQTTLKKFDPKTSGATMRASKLIGMNLQNSRRENVGQINDLVLNHHGEVQYVAVTYGGFLGVGNKMFAVPFEAIRFDMDPNVSNTMPVLRLDVTKEQLDGATGFDEQNWPDFSDPNFTNDLYRRYGVQRRMRNAADRHQSRLDVRVDQNGVDVNVDRNKKP